MNLDILLEREDQFAKLRMFYDVAKEDYLFIPDNLNIKLLREKANQDDAKAQYYLGLFHLEGSHGLSKNKDEALSWLNKAVANNNPTATNYLANYYFLANQEPYWQYLHDKPKPAPEIASKLWQKAYELGNLDALFNMGLTECVASGFFDQEAKPCAGFAKITQAADQGVAQAQLTLALINLLGVAGQKDWDLALKLLQAASKQQLLEANTIIGFMYHSGQYNLPKDTKEAFFNTFSGFSHHRHTNIIEGHLLIAYYYLDGKTTDPDLHLGNYIFSSKIKELNAIPNGKKIIENFDNDKKIFNIKFFINDDEHIESNIKIAGMNLTSKIKHIVDSNIKILTKYAKNGNDQAICYLADYYLEEDINAQSIRPMLIDSANRGYPLAQYFAGQISSDNIHIDEPESHSWYLKAAEQNVPRACFKAGMNYLIGKDGLKQDGEKSIYYLKRFIELNQQESRFDQQISYAYFLLAIHYLHGGLVPQDDKLGLEYLYKSIEYNDINAYQELLRMYYAGICFEKDDSKILELVREIFLRCNPCIAPVYASFYIDGKYLKRDIDKAIGILQQGMEEGYGLCIIELALIYFAGFYPGYTPVDGLKMLQYIGYEPLANVQFILGLLNDLGYLVEQDIEVAMLRYRLGMLYGSEPSTINYAVSVLNGQVSVDNFNEKSNLSIAFKVLKDIAENENPNVKRWQPVAQFNLALCYKRGLGVEQDLELAQKWLQTAADQNDLEAKHCLESQEAFEAATFRKVTVVHYVDFAKLAAGTYQHPKDDEEAIFDGANIAEFLTIIGSHMKKDSNGLTINYIPQDLCLFESLDHFNAYAEEEQICLETLMKVERKKELIKSESKKANHATAVRKAKEKEKLKQKRKNKKR